MITQNQEIPSHTTTINTQRPHSTSPTLTSGTLSPSQKPRLRGGVTRWGGGGGMVVKASWHAALVCSLRDIYSFPEELMQVRFDEFDEGG